MLDAEVGKVYLTTSDCRPILITRAIETVVDERVPILSVVYDVEYPNGTKTTYPAFRICEASASEVIEFWLKRKWAESVNA